MYNINCKISTTWSGQPHPLPYTRNLSLVFHEDSFVLCAIVSITQMSCVEAPYTCSYLNAASLCLEHAQV